MANKYWAAGVSGNWNDILSWSDFAIGTPAGAVVPGAGDAAIFNAASGTVTATLDISPDIQTLTMTGFTGTLAFGTNTISLNSTGTIFTGSTTTTVTGTPLIICTDSSATARTITPTTVTEANSISFRITAGTGGLTFTSGAVVRNLDFTDGTNPTGYAGALSNNAITIYGNFLASTGMSATGSNAFTFAATSGTKTITFNGLTIDRAFTFNGVGGTWQLQDALTSGSARACTLTNGTLDLNGYTATFGSVSSSNSNARTFAFGSTGKIVVTGTNATVYNTSVATGLTITGTRTVEFTGVGTGGQTRTITGGVTTTGGTAATAVDCYIQAGADAIDFGTANRTYRTINFTGFGSGTIAANTRPNIYGDFVLSATMTVTGGTNNWIFAATTAQTITTNSVTINNPITFNGVGGTWAMQDALTMPSQPLTMTNGTLRLKSGTTSTVGSFVTSGTNVKFLQATTPGTQATISDASGTNSVSYLTIQDSYATGGAAWDANASTNVNAGNNFGWFFAPTPADSNEITMRLRSFTQPRRF